MIKLPETNRAWPWVRYFLEEYLPQHRGLSPHTLTSYRTAFRHLSAFLKQRNPDVLSKRLSLKQLQPPLLLEFLSWLESPRGRKVGPGTRNIRLAALRSFFACLELHRSPEETTQWQRLRLLPFKRAPRSRVEHLEITELDQVFSVVPTSTSIGLRDLCLLAVLYNTGARASEVASMRRAGLWLGENPSVRLLGKGRRERICPLWSSTVQLIEQYLERVKGRSAPPSAPTFVFINQRGGQLTRHGVARLVGKYLKLAGQSMPSLQRKRLSTHSFRHTTAIHLLQAGAELNVIKAWLGHRSVRTTGGYLDLNLEPYRELLGRFTPPPSLSIAAERLHSQNSAAPSGDGDMDAWLQQL